MLTLGHIIAGLDGAEVVGDLPAISTVVIDSRQAVAGSLFVAFLGERVDGHDFVANAFENGAIAALVQKTD